MNSKKILIVSKSFYPLKTPRAHRTTELIQEFSRLGHEVHLLIPESDFDYSDFLNRNKVHIHFFGPLKWMPLKGSNIPWIGNLKRKLGRLLFLLFDYPDIEILWKLPQKIRKFSDFDLLISIAVPHSIHWAVSRVRNSKNLLAKTWVADCGDPFMGNKLESIPPPIYFTFLEKQFCRKADYISIPAPGSLEGYYKEFHSKIVVIPQGFSFEGISIIEQFKPGPVLRFAYAGGVSNSGIRSLHKIIEYLLGIDQKFELNVFSQQAKTVLSKFKAHAGDRIICHESIGRIKLIYKLSEMDFLINLDNGTTLNTPSKLIDYSLSKRPILNISAMDPDLQLLDQFLKRNYTNQFKVPPIENYNIKNVASQFIQLI